MKNNIINLKSIKLKNFKNIVNSEITFTNNDVVQNIVGIYGQNGSGKTAIIECVTVLKNLMMGQSYQNDLCFYFNVLSNNMTLEYTFSFNEIYDIKYSVKFIKESIFNEIICENQSVASISKERIDLISIEDGKVSSIEFKLELNKAKIVVNENGNEINIVNDIALACSHISKQLYKSIMFQDLLIDCIKEHELIYDVLRSLRYYSKTNLFVFGMKETSYISALDNLPLNIRTNPKKNGGASGKIALNLFEASDIPTIVLNAITPELEKINILMGSLVPGMKIEYKKIYEGLNENGDCISKIQLVSKIYDKDIPLKYESEGIKKIIALCSVLISLYNDERVTLFIDELDSGVFEYLLGELVKVLYNGAKGQLVFTSHNLRLLEVLPKQSIVFSTVNPRKCFIKMANVKPNNNLRDFYYRAIVLGGQKEELYKQTEDYDIELALRQCDNQ